MSAATPEQVGRVISVVLYGHTGREHPIEDAIAVVAHMVAEKHGFGVAVASGPYYEGGDERDLQLAKAEAEVKRLREALEGIAAIAKPENVSSPALSLDFAGEAARLALSGEGQ